MTQPAINPPPLRIVLCDDAVAYPMMVTAWFRDLEGFALVAVLGTLAELRTRIADLAPDVLLLDIVLPDGDIDAATLAAVRDAIGPDVRIILVSNHLPERLASTAATTGADGWCTKIDGLDGLLLALQQ